MLLCVLLLLLLFVSCGYKITNNVDIIIRNLCLLVVYFFKDIPFGNHLLAAGRIFCGEDLLAHFQYHLFYIENIFHINSNSQILMPPAQSSVLPVWTPISCQNLATPQLSLQQYGSLCFYSTRSTERKSHTPGCILINSTTDNMIPSHSKRFLLLVARVPL